MLACKKIKEKGFGLIELMLSFAILATVMMGILLLQGRLMHSKTVTERADDAKNIAIQRLEDVICRYPYASITTSNVNHPPLFTKKIKRGGIPYLPECTVTDFDDPFNNVGSETGTPPDDYKEIRVTVTYPTVGVKFGKELGSRTVVRYLYNTGTVVNP
jgi:type II secretory pathway pseudopilin PulG